MQAPQNIEIEVVNSTTILVSFDPPEQQMIPGVNLGFKVELWKNSSQNPVRTVRVFPMFVRVSVTIENLEKFGHYNLTVLCFTGPGDGPRSDFVAFTTLEDCEFLFYKNANKKFEFFLVPGPLALMSFDQVMYSSVIVNWEPPIEPNGIILSAFSIKFFICKYSFFRIRFASLANGRTRG